MTIISLLREAISSSLIINHQVFELLEKGPELATASVASKAAKDGDHIIEYLQVSADGLARMHQNIARRIKLSWFLGLSGGAALLIAAASILALFAVPTTNGPDTFHIVFIGLLVVSLPIAWLSFRRPSALSRNPDILRQSISSCLTLWGVGEKALYHTLTNSHGQLIGTAQIDYSAIGSIASQGEPDFNYVRLHDHHGLILTSINHPGGNHAHAIQYIRSRIQQ